jgi:hypothetical protein
MGQRQKGGGAEQKSGGAGEMGHDFPAIEN